jgi:hypothetical protein
MTEAELKILLRTIGRFVGDKIAVKIGPLVDRIEKLERMPFEYHHIWSAEKIYKRNALVTFRGSLWIVVADETVSRPGSGPDDGWRMCVKRGQSAHERKRNGVIAGDAAEEVVA